jgi:XTP/dITP diphosphohydrolase
MKEVIIATRNAGKAKEFVQLFSELGWTVRTLLDYDNIPDVEETGETFEENARIKAETVSSLLNAAVLADDSGLEIDALDGRPGVYSARYAGAEKNDEANIEKVLQELKNVPPEKRTARFRCVLAFAAPGEKTRFFSGTCEGKILTEKRGSNGFGYDPIFYVEEKGKTMAEMDPGEKNQISHRADAVRKLKDWLQNGYPEVREEK